MQKSIFCIVTRFFNFGKEKRKDIVYRMQCMVASKDFKQMEMEEFI